MYYAVASRVVTWSTQDRTEIYHTHCIEHESAEQNRWELTSPRRMVKPGRAGIPLCCFALRPLSPTSRSSPVQTRMPEDQRGVPCSGWKPTRQDKWIAREAIEKLRGFGGPVGDDGVAKASPERPSDWGVYCVDIHPYYRTPSSFCIPAGAARQFS